MVLEDESSDDNSSLPYMPSETSTDGLNQVPFSLEDPDYKGLELDLIVLCEKHGKPSERLVAFEGTMTGRRKVKIVESKSARVNDNLRSALTIHQLTEEKNKLDADYDKLVKDVHQLVDFQQDRVVDFSYLQSAVTYQHQCRAELVAGMNAEMAKKDAAAQKLQQKMNLELKNAEFTKFEKKLTQEKLELKLQVADLLKLKENHNEEKQMQEFKITELIKAEEKLKEKIKGIQAILQN
ncbi:hypothetical protein VPH35_033508 [Triticum aestivum]|uniref:Uncharacterized protein n=1 Tax=Triticum aestivum TaxID=4565 RepID=A0A3B6D3R8_WHEAT